MQGAFYNYGISSVSVNPNNEEILDINFGNGKTPLSIFKDDIEDFIRAILPAEEMKQMSITSEELNKYIELEGIDVLNSLLRGRAMIIISDFKNYLEYANSGQNDIKLITGLNIDGKIEIENAFDYENRQPSFGDLYPKALNHLNKH